MKKQRMVILITILVLSVALFAPACRAGQVVTDDVKSWAKKAIEQEKTLGAAPTANAVAVLYFNNRTRDLQFDPLQKGLAIMLITDLTKVKSLDVVERVRLQALVEELKLGASGLVEQDSAPRVGKLLGAHWLLGGDLAMGQPGRLEIKSDVLDVPIKQIVGEPGSQGILDEIFRMEKDILFEIIKLLKIVPTPEEEVELRKPITTDIKALLDFFKGIEKSDRKEYGEAVKYYESSLKADPKFRLPAECLEELKALGLIGKTNKSQNMLRSLRDRTSLTDQITPEGPLMRERTPRDIRSRGKYE